MLVIEKQTIVLGFLGVSVGDTVCVCVEKK